MLRRPAATSSDAGVPVSPSSAGSVAQGRDQIPARTPRGAAGGRARDSHGCEEQPRAAGSNGPTGDLTCCDEVHRGGHLAAGIRSAGVRVALGPALVAPSSWTVQEELR